MVDPYHLTAEAAENGDDLSKAHDLFRRELVLLDRARDAEDYKALSQQVRELAARITPGPASRRGGSRRRADLAGEFARVPSGAAMTTRPRVAVLGDDPLDETLKGLDYEMINSVDAAHSGDESLREHTSAAVEAFRIRRALGPLYLRRNVQLRRL